MKSLENKNTVITGGSDGIGLGIAQSFAENGANLRIVGRNKEKLEEVKLKLDHYGVKIHTIAYDLSESTGVPALGKQILEYFPRIDVLVNNAGIGLFSPFLETEQQRLDLHINLNIRTPFLLTQALLPALIKAKGNVINISSYFAHRMLQGRDSTCYSITKGAINSFTKSLAFEIGHLGVRVNAIAPGSVQTPQLTRNLQLMPETGQEHFHNMIKNIYPMGHIGKVDDIGNAATFLASEQANWITGVIMPVDGGLTTN